MDIKEVREHKATLEEEIQKVIAKFEKETLCETDSIALFRPIPFTGDNPYLPLGEYFPVTVFVHLRGL